MTAKSDATDDQVDADGILEQLKEAPIMSRRRKGHKGKTPRRIRNARFDPYNKKRRPRRFRP